MTDILTGAAPFFTEDKTIKAVAVNGHAPGRKFIDALAEKCKLNGAENMYWFKLDENGALAGGIAKFAAGREQALAERLELEPGAFVAAGFLRTELGTGLDLIEKDAFRFCWIVDFPMYEYDDEGNLTFCHNPFSMPQGGLEALNTMQPTDILAYQYDSVVNGVELSSGAVRNHEPAIMERAFEIRAEILGALQCVQVRSAPSRGHRSRRGQDRHASCGGAKHPRDHHLPDGSQRPRHPDGRAVRSHRKAA